jgi:hypothetical protein
VRAALVGPQPRPVNSPCYLFPRGRWNHTEDNEINNPVSAAYAAKALTVMLGTKPGEMKALLSKH